MHLPDLQSSMRAGALLLTPTQRSARLWREQILRVQPLSTPTVLPWGAWTAALWQRAVLRGNTGRTLLNATQNAELWAGVIRASQPGTLRPVQSLVDLCTQAEYLLHAHRAANTFLHSAPAPGSDSDHFQSWFRAHTDLCRRSDLLPAAALEAALLDHTALADARHELLLLDLDDPTPARAALLEKLAQQGHRITHVRAADLAGIQDTPATVHTCHDEPGEWSFLAEALQNALAADPHPQIVVVLPDTDTSRPALERQLRHTLPPASTTAAPLWEFSEGRPLHSLPIAADALALLRWATHPAAAATVGALLRSPYLYLGFDLESAAEFETRTLLKPLQLIPEWTIETIAQRAPTIAAKELLQSLHTLTHSLRGRRLPGAWAESTAALLQAAGWPGRRELSTEEFQSIDRWNDLLDSLASLDLLDSLASLDLLDSPLPFAEFLTLLTDGATRLRFAPENRGAPIQILSPDEAVGVTADLLWIAHADETRWSGRRSASPLLPWPLQVDHGMPGTDAARDGEAHLHATQRILRSGKTVALSYAASNASGNVKPAAVLKLFPGVQWSQAHPAPARIAAPHLQTMRDDTGPLFTSADPIAGGVTVLQSQAACAFRAFAEKRLYSTEPQPTDLGYDARDRGTLLHGILERFWSRTRTQGELLRLHATGELERTVRDDVAAVVSDPSAKGWPAAYLELQRRRLSTLVLHWLSIEADRPPFAVAVTEQEVPAEMGGLHFNLRVDRIDQVLDADSSPLVLIDYKSGSTRTADWLGSRPEQPQLPLYAVAAGLTDVQAIAFASLKPGAKNMRIDAFPSGTPLLFRKSKAQQQDWDEQTDQWRETLQQLAHDFAAGDAHVDPKQYPATCNHCGQRMLCRLNPESFAAPDDEEEEDHA